MTAGRYCYQHPQDSRFAYCAKCVRPCCRDCAVEFMSEYLCGECKKQVADQLAKHAVNPVATIAVLAGVLSLFTCGLVMGPVALWYARQAEKTLDRTPWMRGLWHARAAYVLGSVGTIIGILTGIQHWLESQA